MFYDVTYMKIVWK